MRCPENERMGPDEVWRHGEHLASFLWKKNIVLDSAEAGAGHLRQEHYEYGFLDGIGLGDNVTLANLDICKNRWFRTYAKLQRYPKLYAAISVLVNSPAFAAAVDREVLKLDKSETLREKLGKAKSFKNDRETVVVTTHVVGSVSARRLNPTWPIIEKIPDPWRGWHLRSMASPLVNSVDVAVVYDQQTALEYQKMRPGRQVVMPWGTLSDSGHLLGRIPQRKTTEGVEVGIEFSGNDIPEYTRMGVEFIRSIASEISSGKIHLGVHTMHHQEVKQTITQTLTDLGLWGNGWVKVMSGRTIEEAVVTRNEWLASEGRPMVSFIKGGEGTLEQRDMLAAAVYAAGHEVRDIQVGLKDGRAINLLGVQPNKWWERVKEEVEKRNGAVGCQVQSWAVLGLLGLDVAYLKQHFAYEGQ